MEEPEVIPVEETPEETDARLVKEEALIEEVAEVVESEDEAV